MKSGGGTHDYGKAYVAGETDRVFGVISLDKAAMYKIARPVVKAERIETRMVLRKAKIKMNHRLLKKIFALRQGSIAEIVLIAGELFGTTIHTSK